MSAPPRPDLRDRSIAGVARLIAYFGEVDAPQIDGFLYSALAREIARDAELLAIAAHAPPSQPPANGLFAAVHALLLGGEPHALREWYPELASGPCRPADTAFPAFRDFCLLHRERLAGLVATRRTQTNVISRCSALVPAFARSFAEGGGRPLALVEIGASAGLNLRWDRFRYAWWRGARERVVARWGEPTSRAAVEAELRGPAPLPELPERIPVAWRLGIDLNPLDLADAEQVLWLRALIWPDHPGRQEQLGAAIALAQQAPVELWRGDAAERLPAALAAAPPDATLCVYGTHTLYQFPRDALIATLGAMQQVAAGGRPVDFVSCEGTGARWAEMRTTRYRGSERETALIARCCPHGRWVEWVEEGAEGGA